MMIFVSDALKLLRQVAADGGVACVDLPTALLFGHVFPRLPEDVYREIVDSVRLDITDMSGKERNILRGPDNEWVYMPRWALSMSPDPAPGKGIRYPDGEP